MRTATAIFSGVGVLPEYRGRGIGRAMITDALRRHFAENSTPVMLEVAVQNNGALGLYESCGFETVTAYDYFEQQL